MPKVNAREETGMEGELNDKIGKFDLRNQVEAFYTAYSKVLFPFHVQLLRVVFM